MGQASDGTLSPNPHYYEIMGRAAEIARALGSPAGGAEHVFLGMLHDGGWPVSVVSRLVDFGRAEEAVLGLLGEPGYSPPPAPRLPVPGNFVQPWGMTEDAVFLPEGQGLDGPLSRAIVDALPQGATFGFNLDADGRTWLQVFQPGGDPRPGVTREVLNAALASLGRPVDGK